MKITLSELRTLIRESVSEILKKDAKDAVEQFWNALPEAEGERRDVRDILAQAFSQNRKETISSYYDLKREEEDLLKKVRQQGSTPVLRRKKDNISSLYRDLLTHKNPYTGESAKMTIDTVTPITRLLNQEFSLKSLTAPLGKRLEEILKDEKTRNEFFIILQRHRAEKRKDINESKRTKK